MFYACIYIYIVFNYIWGTSKRIKTLKISAKYLEKRLFTPVHTFFNIDNSTVGFSMQNKPIYRYMLRRITTTNNVSHKSHKKPLSLFQS